jgi:6-phosphogluconolactonase
MQIEVLPDGEAASLRGAKVIAAAARDAVAARGRFLMAVSGGKNPWKMFRALTQEDVPWEKVEILQVDERVAPDGDPDRNLTHLRESLLGHAAPLRPEQIHAMPVTDPDLEAAAGRYARLIEQLAGDQPVIDLVHLGMGPDGHTASLVPGDPVLDVSDVDVALTGVYQKRRRMTLTYPVLNRARNILWLITDDTKADALVRLMKGDRTIPAGRIRSDRAQILADRAAASKLENR